MCEGFSSVSAKMAHASAIFYSICTQKDTRQTKDQITQAVDLQAEQQTWTSQGRHGGDANSYRAGMIT